MLDRSVEAIKTMVALKAVCACDGRNARTALAISEGLPGGD